MSTLRRILRRRAVRRFVLALAVFLAFGLLTAWQQWSRGAVSSQERHELQTIAYRAAQRHGVDPCLVMGVIQAESAWRAGAVGRAGEVGLMQIMPGAIADWERVTGRDAGTRRDQFAPELNIEIGTWYLARALNRWEDRAQPEVWALLQYNAGPTVATELAATREEIELADIPIPSTRTYISKVTANRDRIRKAGQCQSPPPTTAPPSTP